MSGRVYGFGCNKRTGMSYEKAPVSDARRSSVAFCSMASVATTPTPAADPVAGRTWSCPRFQDATVLTQDVLVFTSVFIQDATVLTTVTTPGDPVADRT